MEPYITFREPDKSGEFQYYILQRSFPHYLAIILHKPKEGAIVCMPVAGHHLYLAFAGTIQGNYLLARNDLQRELQFIFEQMADWFYNKRVLAEPKKYKKFKI